MPTIPMPNGDQVSFPDDMPKDQIKALIAKKFPSDVASHLRDQADAVQSGDYTGMILPLRRDKSGLHFAVPTAVQSLLNLPENLVGAAATSPPGSRELTETLVPAATETGAAAVLALVEIADAAGNG